MRFVLASEYQLCHHANVSQCPRQSSIPTEITKLVEVISQRPNIAAYIKENAHKD